MNTPARFCLRVGTLVLSLMVTWLWAGTRAQSSATTMIDVSDPTVQLAFGVLQSGGAATQVHAGQVAPSQRVQTKLDGSANAPALSDLMMPDEIVPVVAPAAVGPAASKTLCEDV
jgi:hypothetical protein